MPAFSMTRASIVLMLNASLLVAMIARVAYLETYGRQKMVRWADRQQHTSTSITARRGSLFDRNGITMAGTVQTLAVYLDPQFMLKEYQKDKRTLDQMDQDLRKLARLLECDADQLSQVISQRQDKEYVRIAENLDERMGQEVLKLNIPGVGMEPVCVRYYPMGSIAAHVLGSVGAEGQGLEGMELAFDKLLAGKNGYKRLEKDARRRAIGIDAEDYIPPQHGQHLVLTIDANIQMVAEEELAAACVRHRAKRGEAIIMDPRTGEVLAMANWPTFNPQNPGEAAAEARTNSSIVMPYEPGSTLKPFIMGPALAWQVTRVNEVWPIRGNPYITPYGRRVSDVHGNPPLSSWDVLVKSSNIGMAMLAERMGNTKLHRALNAFGFGRRTGIELPAEDSGLVNPLRRWTRYSTESVAQGYEMRVTPLQLARAFCVYANGGHLVRPRLVKGVLDADGKIVPRQPEPGLESTPLVVDPDTADMMRRVLSDVMVRGTGRGARSKYWNIFGKTGSSHISRGRQGYASNLLNASFMGGAPVEDPRLVIALVLHEADRSYGHGYGGAVAAPAAARVLERALAYLQVPQSPRLPPPPPQVVQVLHNFNARLYAEETATVAE